MMHLISADHELHTGTEGKTAICSDRLGLLQDAPRLADSRTDRPVCARRRSHPGSRVADHIGGYLFADQGLELLSVIPGCIT